MAEAPASKPCERDGAKPLTPLQDTIVYGPIRSRRFGYSLGINPLPTSYKFCDFDCVYCQYGWTPFKNKTNCEKIKRAPEILTLIERDFKHHRKIKSPVDCITIAGNGEPALHPDFPQLVTGIMDLRDRYYPRTKVGILSDSSQVHRPEIRQAFELLDERYMKLDAGTAEGIKRINQPKGNFDFSRMIRGLQQLSDIVIQSMFLEGHCGNTAEEDIQSWIRAIDFIHPQEVQVYTVDRGPADPRIKEVSFKELRRIAAACEKATGIRSIVYE